jgi:hypothetical protein
MPAPSFTTHEIATELRRELAMRERLYPGWITKGTMKPGQAARQIALLKAAIAKIEEKFSYDEIKRGA